MAFTAEEVVNLLSHSSSSSVAQPNAISNTDSIVTDIKRATKEIPSLVCDVEIEVDAIVMEGDCNSERR